MLETKTGMEIDWKSEDGPDMNNETQEVKKK